MSRNEHSPRHCLTHKSPGRGDREGYQVEPWRHHLQHCKPACTHHTDMLSNAQRLVDVHAVHVRREVGFRETPPCRVRQADLPT